MDKTAQKRQIGLLNKLREDTDIPGKLTEKVSPEFASLMEKLRTIDNEVRELAISDENGGTLKSLLKVAKSNFNRREYVNTVIYLGKFHEKLQEIKDKFGSLQKDLTKAHNEFLFGDLDPDQKDFLMKKMPGKFAPKSKEKKASYADLIVKEAGVSDIWHNMTTERGKALKAWEKRFPQFAKTLKKETEKMINRSEVMFQVLTSTLKTLAAERANRRLEEYVKNAEGFSKKYEQYDDFFNEYYNSNVSRLIETQKSIDSDVASKIEEAIPADTIEETSKAEKAEEIIAPESVETPNSFNPGHEPTPPSSYSPKTENVGPLSPPSGGGGEPANFPTPPSYTGVHPDVAEKMKMLEQQMEETPSAPENVASVRAPRTVIPSTNRDFVAPPIDSRFDSEGEPVFQLNNAPRTQKVPSMPYMSTERPVQPSASGITLKDPSINFLNPSIPKAPLVPRELQNISLFDGDQKGTIPAAPLALRGPDTEIDSPRTQKSAEQFVAELSAIAHESPIVIANKIVKFANSIANSDKATSDKLLSIARTILTRI